MKRVDVVIPCYNYGHYLRGCVESVLRQEGVETRLLVIDDCSPDNTPQVAAELVREDGRVEYRRHAVNQRHIDTYNEGLLEWASAEYCMLLSADDVLAPGALGRAVAIMEAHPEVGLTHGRQVVFDKTPPVLSATSNAAPVPSGDFAIQTGAAFIEACCEVAGNPVATPTAVLRTSLQHEVGGYRKSLPHSADMEMWLRCAARASVASLDAVQAFKRMHASNMQYQYLQNPLGDLRERHETFASFFAADGHLVSERARLEAFAVRRLGEQAFWAASRAFEAGNHAGCDMCLDQARQWHPEQVGGPAWRRLQWKRRLGRRAWRLMSPLMDRVRPSKPVGQVS